MIITDYFHNGVLYRVTPEGGSPYNALMFISEGTKYSLLSKTDLYNLPIPNFWSESSFPDTKKNEDYILRMCAKNIYKYDPGKGITAMKKACDMMLKSNIKWCHEDYLYLVKMLYKEGRIEEAEKTEDIINKLIPFGNTVQSRKKLVEKMLNIAIKNCALLHTNLLIISGSKACSAYDAMLRNRVFCIDGKDKRFMELPVIREDSYCNFAAFIYGISKMYDSDGKQIKDIVAYSNRPFIDDRTDEEKENYLAWLNETKKPIQYWVEEKQFYYLKYRHPEICPHSKYAFDKLKRENYAEFAKLISVLPDKYKEYI